VSGPRPRPAWLSAYDAQVEQYRYLVERHPRPNVHDDDLDRFVQIELYKLLHADPVFVAAELCELIEAALPTFEPEPLADHDLLTPTGFLLFERVVTAPHVEGDSLTSPFSAFSWAAVKWPADAAGPYVLNVTYYADTGTGGKRLPLLGTEWAFGDDAAEQASAPLLRLVQTTFRLMREFKPAGRSTEQLPRAERRAAARAGFEMRSVVVVRLRRERRPHEPLGGTANYSHRFLVAGHWRNQWCPSLGVHRQTWISPYVKGPADKPLKPPHGRAFVLNR
jgi:hypothetical protein